MWLRQLLKADALMVDTLMGHVCLDNARVCATESDLGLVGPLMGDL
jgi:hypothetical protein